MPSPKKSQNHSSGDERYKRIDNTLKRFKFQEDALLEVLNSAQEIFGYLSPDLLQYVADHLDVPIARVYGVATFYHMFTFEPLGKHTCIVCTGTACYVKGAERIAQSIAAEFDMQSSTTTPDNLLSLTSARCVGSCGLAPVVVLDGVVRGKETPEATTLRVKEVIALSKESLQAAE